MWFYRFVRAVVDSTFKVVFRVRVTGREHVPRKGAYVVAPSHRSILDIPFTSFITRRRIRFMAKKELFSTWIGRHFFQWMGAIEVDREAADRTALRAASAAILDGEPVGVFPEGTRNEGPVLGELHDGAAYLALKHGIPVLPVGVGGSEEIMERGRLFPRFKKVAVVIGPVIPVPPEGSRRRAEITALTGVIRERVQGVFDEARARAGVAGSAPSEAGERR